MEAGVYLLSLFLLSKTEHTPSTFVQNGNWLPHSDCGGRRIQIINTKSQEFLLILHTFLSWLAEVHGSHELVLIDLEAAVVVFVILPLKERRGVAWYAWSARGAVGLILDVSILLILLMLVDLGAALPRLLASLALLRLLKAFAYVVRVKDVVDAVTILWRQMEVTNCLQAVVQQCRGP